MPDSIPGPQRNGTTSPPNEILDAGHFYVSFNPADTHLYGGPTTALVWGQMERFFILNGDHRAAYAERIPMGWSSCLDYFAANPGLVNPLSDPLPGADDMPAPLGMRPAHQACRRLREPPLAQPRAASA